MPSKTSSFVFSVDFEGWSYLSKFTLSVKLSGFSAFLSLVSTRLFRPSIFEDDSAIIELANEEPMQKQEEEKSDNKN